ncbi:unnamed protein product [Discosporangium mesarthrocarpum]
MNGAVVIAQPEGTVDEPSSSATSKADCQVGTTQTAQGTAALQTAVGVPLDNESVRMAMGVPTQKHSAGRTQQLYDSHFETKNQLEARRKEEVAVALKSARLQLQSKQLNRAVGEHLTIHEHLFKMAAEQREKMALRVTRVDQSCSFQPQLPTRSIKTSIMVTQEDHNPSRARYKTIKAEEEMYQECTFKPDTSDTRGFKAKMTSSEEIKGPIYERLYRTPEEQAITIKQRRKARKEKELQRCTFHPNMDATRKSRAAKSLKRPSEPVHKHLYSLHKDTLARKSARRGELAAEENMQCSFSPTLVTKNVRKEDTSTSSVFDRLYAAGHNKTPTNTSVDPECTFSPRLKSKKTGVQKGLEGEDRIKEMYEAGKAKQHRRSSSPRGSSEALRERQIEKDLALCTFSPDVSPTAKSRFKKRNHDADVFSRLYSSRESFAAAREGAQQEEMARFSFSPELVSQSTKIGRVMAAVVEATVPSPPERPSHTSREWMGAMPPAAPTLADEGMGQGQEEDGLGDAGDEEMGVVPMLVEEGDMTDYCYDGA